MVSITADVGGTFTDVVVRDDRGKFTEAKSPTTARAVDAVLAAVAVIAERLDLSSAELLARAESFVYSTTRSTNAILERRTARTALLVTEGFPDILTLREGGKANAFDFVQPYPEPYVPRSLTFEIPERIDVDGSVRRPLDDVAAKAVIERLIDRDVEAVAVCLLSSTINPEHELRLGQLLDASAPNLPHTLSHQVNPTVREDRRASSAAIDASLKPLMSTHLQEVKQDLARAGFVGTLTVASSLGGVLEIDDIRARPIHSIRSGPSLAPVAGRDYSQLE